LGVWCWLWLLLRINIIIIFYYSQSAVFLVTRCISFITTNRVQHTAYYTAHRTRKKHTSSSPRSALTRRTKDTKHTHLTKKRCRLRLAADKHTNHIHHFQSQRSKFFRVRSRGGDSIFTIRVKAFPALQ
jgi:hypothetical protein